MRTVETIAALACALLAWTHLAGCQAPTNSPQQQPSYVGLQESEADREFETGMNRPPTARTLYAMARILVAQGRDSEAQFLLKRILSENRTFMPAYCELAELQARNRQVEDAIATLSEGLKASPKDHVLLNNLGMCHMLKDNYDSALDCFGAAASVSPQDARYRSNLATALGMKGRYEEALALYAQVVSPADAHRNLAVLCQARKDLYRAVREHEIARRLEMASATPGIGATTAPAQ